LDSVVRNPLSAIKIHVRCISVCVVDDSTPLLKRPENVLANLCLCARAAPELTHIRQELRVFPDGRIAYFEASVAGPKSDGYDSLLSILVLDLNAPHHGKERGQSLLPIDDQSSGAEGSIGGAKGPGLPLVRCVPEH
jgi:hypothetical protein